MSSLLFFPIIILIGIIIIFLVMEHLFKKIISIFALIVIVFLVFVGMIYFDVKDLVNNFPDKPKIILFDSQNQIITGGKVSGLEEIKDVKDIYIFSEEEINAINELYLEKEYKKILEDNYKLFVIKEPFFQNITLKINEFPEANTENIIDIIKNNEEIPEEFNFLLSSLEIPSSKIQGIAFLALAAKTISQEGPFYIVRQYKKGNIILYKETITFEIVKIFPEKYFEKILNKKIK